MHILFLLVACSEKSTELASPTIEITPSAPRATDNLSVQILDAPEADEGETIAYEYLWLLDGVEQNELTQAEVSSDNVLGGQEWTVQVQAFGK